MTSKGLEGAWQTHDPTGYALRTRWYIECKWYTGSVPFVEIEPKLLAAECARADYLLVVTSSRVMNTAMDSIQRWLDARAHPFRVRYWNGHDVLRRVVRHRNVYEKHFPLAGTLPWAMRDAEVERLRALVAHSSERLVWGVVPALQWAAQHLAAFKNTPQVTPVIAELELLLGSIRLHELLATSEQTLPATRPTSVSETLKEAVADVARKSKVVKQLAAPDCMAISSGPILRALLFELLINAAKYAEGAPPTVELTISVARWSILVKNASRQPLLGTWPVLGYRGEMATRINPSGQGMGASLARAGADSLNLSLTWTVDANVWTAELGGSLA